MTKLFLLMLIAGFQQNTWADTITVIGPTKQKLFNKIRYLTTYEKITVEEPYPNMPYVEEDCHDESDRFFNWSRSMSYTMTYDGSVSFELLGLEFGFGAEKSKEIQISFQKWVQASKNIRARHYLMKRYENLIGKTQKEVWDENNQIWTIKGKPKKFEVNQVNMGLFVKREVLEVCQ